MIVQQGDHLQHLLIVFVVAKSLAVSLQKRHIVGDGKFTAEFVDIYGFIVGMNVAETKVLSGQKFGDVVLLIQKDDGSVHPALKGSHQGQGWVGVIDDLGEKLLLKDQIGFQKQSIVLQKIILCQVERIDVVGGIIDRIFQKNHRGMYGESSDKGAQLLPLVTGHKDNLFETIAVQLTQHTLNHRHTIDGNHALGLVFRQLFQTPAHSGSQYDSLHRGLLSCSKNIKFINY